MRDRHTHTDATFSLYVLDPPQIWVNPVTPLGRALVCSLFGNCGKVNGPSESCACCHCRPAVSSGPRPAGLLHRHRLACPCTPVHDHQRRAAVKGRGGLGSCSSSEGGEALMRRVPPRAPLWCRRVRCWRECSRSRPLGELAPGDAALRPKHGSALQGALQVPLLHHRGAFPPAHRDSEPWVRSHLQGKAPAFLASDLNSKL